MSRGTIGYRDLFSLSNITELWEALKEKNMRDPLSIHSKMGDDWDIYIYKNMVGGLALLFLSIYWESSSQLINIFSEGLKPPTKYIYKFIYIYILGVGYWVCNGITIMGSLKPNIWVCLKKWRKSHSIHWFTIILPYCNEYKWRVIWNTHMRYRTSLVGSAHFVFDELRKWPMACLLLATIGLRPQNPSETKAEISGFSWRYSFLARIWKLWDFTVTRCIRGIGKGPSQHWNNNLHNMFYFWWRFWSGIYILFAEHQPADILDSCVFFGRYLCIYIYIW